MKNLYFYITFLISTITLSSYAITQEEYEYYQDLNEVDKLTYQLKLTREALSTVDIRSSRYRRLIYVCIGLIECTAKHGLTISDRIFLYRSVLDAHQKAASDLQQTDSVVIIDGEEITLNKALIKIKAIEHVLINKISALLEEYKQQSNQQDGFYEQTIPTQTNCS